MKGWKTSFWSRAVLRTFPETSSSCARGTVSVAAGSEGRELNESLFMGVGTSGCDNSQRGVSEGVSPATFASLLSVNLPVHLSGCHTVLRRLTNSIYIQNMYLFKEEEMHSKCSTAISDFAFVQRFSTLSNYYSCRYKEFKVFYESCLADSHQTDSSITQPLHLSLTLIRNPFQMSSQFLFFLNKAQNEQKNRQRTDSAERRSAWDYMSNCVSTLLWH